MEISKIINKARLNSGCTMSTVEKSTGILASNQSKIELGNNTNPGFFAIGKLADFYGLDLTELYKATQSKTSSSLIVSKTKLITIIPIITSKEIDRWLLGDKAFINEDTQTATVSGKCSDLSFSMKIKDDSMTSYSGGSYTFPIDSTIVVDPAIPLKNDSFVIVKLKEDNVISFRQAVYKDGEWYFKCVNTQYQLLTTSQNFEILGKVISMTINV